MRENQAFNELVEAFKLLPLDKKKKKVEQEIKELLAFIMKANADVRVKSEPYYNRELLDLNAPTVSDDDFVEAMFVYIGSIKEMIGQYFNEVAKILYEEEK